MNINVKAKKEKTEAGPTPPRPRELVCVDPAQRALVFDFFKGFYQDRKETVIVHLKLCLDCREAVTAMLKLDECFENQADEPFHAARPGGVTVGAESASTTKADEDLEKMYRLEETADKGVEV